MKIKFTAENQRRIIVCEYDRNAVSEDLTDKEVLLCLLGDFYLSQNTYTRITKIAKGEYKTLNTLSKNCSTCDNFKPTKKSNCISIYKTAPGIEKTRRKNLRVFHRVLTFTEGFVIITMRTQSLLIV